MRRLLWVLALFSGVGCSDDVEPPEPMPMDSSVVEDAIPDTILDAEIPLPSLSCGSGWVTHRLGEPERIAPMARRVSARPPRMPLRTHSGRLVAGEMSPRSGAARGWWFAHLAPEHARTIEERWRADGVEVTERLGRGFVTLFHPGHADWEGFELPGVSSARPVRVLEKVHPWLAQRAQLRSMLVSVARFIEGQGIVHESHSLGGRAELLALARQPSVLSIRAVPPRLNELERTRAVMGVDLLQGFRIEDGAPVYEGLSGRGIRAAVVDSGVDLVHPDFALYDEAGVVIGSRAMGDGPHEENDHGTHVASILAGSGHLSDGYRIAGEVGTPFSWRGVAPGVESIVSVGYATRTSREVWLRAFVDGDAHLSNHSYTQTQGFYIWRAANADGAIRDGATEGEIQRPPRPMIWSAGNYALGPPDIEGIQFRGFHSVMSTGKNPISVGATYVNDGQVAVASSLGPTLDGRIKPDVMGPGFVEHRPADGIELEIRRVTIHANEGSGREDIEVTIADSWPSAEWSVHGEFSEAEVRDGALYARLWGGRGAEIRYRPEEPFPAADYDRVSFEGRIVLDTAEGAYRWPNHFRVVWNNQDENRPRAGRDYGYAEETQNSEWHTWSAEVAGERRYNNQIHFLALRPLEYPYREIIAAKPEERYRQGGGTSMSAPAVAGVVALMAEEFREGLGYDLEAAPPRPSSFKAMLIHTARDLVRDTPIFRGAPNPETGETLIYGPGPDFVTGWGSVEPVRVVDLLRLQREEAEQFREEEISEGEWHSWRIPVDGAVSDSPLRVTVAWDDVPGPVMSSDFEPKLVNDLDIVLISPSGQAHGPWVLDPLPIDEETYFEGLDPITTADLRPARRCTSSAWWQGEDTLDCEDHLNNVEQVLVDRPETGWWTLYIRGHSVPEGAQIYSLVMTQECSSASAD